MTIFNRPAFFALSAAIVLSGCATSPPPGSLATMGLGPVPALKVTVDCGGCKVRPDVPLRIVDSYNMAASAAGVKVSDTVQAVATIKSYSERNDTARLLAGAFAGKDEIQMQVAAPGKNFNVEEYFVNIFQGMDSVIQSIGEKTFSEMRK